MGSTFLLFQIYNILESAIFLATAIYEFKTASIKFKGKHKIKSAKEIAIQVYVDSS